MISFITGSRAYGTVTPKSDIDLVVRMDEATAQLLRKLSDPVLTRSGDPQIVIKFGRINIIACTTDEQFAVWRLGTTQMQRSGKRHDWEQAKNIFDVLREAVGIKDLGDSPGKTPGYKEFTIG